MISLDIRNSPARAAIAVLVIDVGVATLRESRISAASGTILDGRDEAAAAGVPDGIRADIPDPHRLVIDRLVNAMASRRTAFAWPP